jgi:phage recombination protein Bet
MTAIVKSDFTREQIDTIKKTVARGASDTDLALFLEFCKSRRLDPFTRQVYWTPKGIITSIDGFRAKAEETGAYVPGPTRYEYDADGRLIAAHVTVRKLASGQWFDIEESAYMDEYKANTPTWTKLPRVMLSKCAEARAIRRCFPMIVGGMYEFSEMDQAQRDEPRPVVVVQQDDGIEFPSAPTSCAAYTAAVNAIADATTLDQLKVIAGRISAAKEHMTAQEQSDLRARYNARRQEVA